MGSTPQRLGGGLHRKEKSSNRAGTMHGTPDKVLSGLTTRCGRWTGERPRPQERGPTRTHPSRGRIRTQGLRQYTGVIGGRRRPQEHQNPRPMTWRRPLTRLGGSPLLPRHLRRSKSMQKNRELRDVYTSSQARLLAPMG